MNHKHAKGWYGNFWAKVNKTDGCWFWLGSTRKSSRTGQSMVYGTSYHGKKLLPAHRVSWEIVNNREVPVGFFVLHKCDVTLCVNPSHLFIGTHEDNMRDMVLKGRNKRKAA